MIDTHRRRFFGSAAAVAAITTLPAVASPDRYQETMRLLKQAVAVKEDEIKCSHEFNRVLAYMRDNFRPPPRLESDPVAFRSLVKSYNDYRCTCAFRSAPLTSPQVPDEIYPLVVATMALRGHALPLYPCHIELYKWFHDTYGQIAI